MLDSLCVNFSSTGDNFFFLSGKVLVRVSLLSFLLQQTNGLQWSLALNYIGTNPVQIFFSDFRIWVLSDLIVNFFEELLYFLLLIDVHYYFCFIIISF